MGREENNKQKSFDAMETEMEKQVDVLPTKEMVQTLMLFRRLTVDSLRAASKILNNLADTLEVDQEKNDDTSDIPNKVKEIVCDVQIETSGRARTESVVSLESGFGDDVDFCLAVDSDTGLEVVTLDEVSYHCTRDDAWLVLFDKVYDLTEYLESSNHPGGEDVILEYLGYDATMAFRSVGHSKKAVKLLEKYVVGILPIDERLNFSQD